MNMKRPQNLAAAGLFAVAMGGVSLSGVLPEAETVALAALDQESNTDGYDPAAEAFRVNEARRQNEISRQLELKYRMLDMNGWNLAQPPGRQPLGHQYEQTGPNRWEYRPVYPEDMRPEDMQPETVQPQFDGELLPDGIPPLGDDGILPRGRGAEMLPAPSDAVPGDRAVDDGSGGKGMSGNGASGGSGPSLISPLGSGALGTSSQGKGLPGSKSPTSKSPGISGTPARGAQAAGQLPGPRDAAPGDQLVPQSQPRKAKPTGPREF